MNLPPISLPTLLINLQELDKARDVVADLEDELKAERSRLRGLNTEQGRFERQKNDVLLQLQRTESVSKTYFVFATSLINSAGHGRR
jgi:hypothetical protein